MASLRWHEIGILVHKDNNQQFIKDSKTASQLWSCGQESQFQVSSLLSCLNSRVLIDCEFWECLLGVASLGTVTVELRKGSLTALVSSGTRSSRPWWLDGYLYRPRRCTDPRSPWNYFIILKLSIWKLHTLKSFQLRTINFKKSH